MNLTRPSLPKRQWTGTMTAERDIIMTIRRSFLVLASLVAAATLSGCAIYEGTDAVCPHTDPNSANWPYCGPASPGGSQPGDPFSDYG